MITIDTSQGRIIYADEQVETTWYAPNKAHYERLGYSFTKVGDRFFVSMLDLVSTSKQKVSVICPDCGETRLVSQISIKRYGKSTCQACARRTDLSGQTFERLLVLYRYVERKDKNRNTYWTCRCDCGNIISARAWGLTSGDTKSCGCYQRDITAKMGRLHKGENNPNYGKYGELSPRFVK